MNTKQMIRNGILASAIFLSGSNSFAQGQPYEFYPIGTSWEEVYTTYTLPGDVIDPTIIPFRRTIFKIDCDTIVGELTYKIVHSTITENLSVPSQVGNTSVFYIREQDDSVFYRGGFENSKEKPLYDFHWNDSTLLFCGIGWPITYEFVRTQEILLDGNVYDCYMYETFGGVYNKIFRTIGQTIGGLLKSTYSRNGFISHLTKFTRNNVLIYENDIPTPQVTAIHDVSYNDKSGRQDCYTIQGVKVDVTNLKPGVYIQNGRKFVVR